ncbi:protein phosphatase 2C domain-containing protein, partial [Imhoffiella purpurea]|uniref:protein phosphatase 2C domain-containing protein n=1 Tax=Imhoffiella purpurea TaxID=1249627 RepID=UPI001E648A4C
MPPSDQEDPSIPPEADSDTGSQPDAAPRPSPDTKPETRPGNIPSAGTPDPVPPDPRASFSLPNAKVGVAYAETLQGRGPDGTPVRVVEVRLPEGLGLGFDPDRGEVSGTPAHQGDYRIPLRWTLDGKETYSGECLLIVNPDPQSLWKVLEPPRDAPYPKPHVDSRLIQGDDYRILAASRRGRSHEHAGSFRDDDFHIARNPDSGWDLILVADGAGSAPFSREGSRLPPPPP